MHAPGGFIHAGHADEEEDNVDLFPSYNLCILDLFVPVFDGELVGSVRHRRKDREVIPSSRPDLAVIFKW